MIIISKVTPNEIPEVKALLKLVWTDTYGTIYPPNEIEKITSVWHDPERLLEQSQDPDGYFATAKIDENKIIGLITMRRLNKSVLFMSRLYVHPDKQRQGIGTRLFGEALTHFPQVERVALEVEEHNTKGKAFYEKRGFAQVGTKQIQFEKWSIPVVVMEKLLDKDR